MLWAAALRLVQGPQEGGGVGEEGRPMQGDQSAPLGRGVGVLGGGGSAPGTELYGSRAAADSLVGSGGGGAALAELGRAPSAAVGGGGGARQQSEDLSEALKGAEGWGLVEPSAEYGADGSTTVGIPGGAAVQEAVPAGSAASSASLAAPHVPHVLLRVLDAVSEDAVSISAAAAPRELAAIAVASARIFSAAGEALAPPGGGSRSPGVARSSRSEGSTPLPLPLLRPERLFGPLVAAASSPQFLRRANGPALAALAWATATAGFRSTLVIKEAARRLLGRTSDVRGEDGSTPDLRSGGGGGSGSAPDERGEGRGGSSMDRMSPGPLHQLLWAAAASRCYSLPLFSALAGKLALHVGGRGGGGQTGSYGGRGGASCLVDTLWALAVTR